MDELNAAAEPNPPDNKCLLAQNRGENLSLGSKPILKGSTEEIDVLSLSMNNASIMYKPDNMLLKQHSPSTNLKLRERDGDTESEGEMENHLKSEEVLLLRKQCSAKEREVAQLRETLRRQESRCAETEAEIMRLRSALITSERACSRQSALLSRSLVDREVIASEARACEQELSEVEDKIHHLTAEILTRESRIIQLEGCAVPLDEMTGRREVEEKISQMTLAFKEALREHEEQLRARFYTENKEAATEKIKCLQQEIESLKASHAEAVDIITKRAEANAQTDAHTIRQLQDKIAQLQSQLDSQRQEMDDLEVRNNRFKAEVDHLERFGKSMQIRVEEAEVKVVRERTKAEQLEAELTVCRSALASSERNLHELALDHEVARERINVSDRRFEAMHAQIVELNASLQVSTQQSVLLEAKVKESEQRNDMLERRLDQAEKKAKQACDWKEHLEEENVALKTTNQRLTSTVSEMQSSCTTLRCERENSNLEIVELKNLLNNFEVEREANEATLSENLRIVGIALPICPELCNGESGEPLDHPLSKYTKRHRVLDVSRAVAQLTARIVAAEAENTQLREQIATQDAHLVDQRTQATILNDNLLQLETHLRSAREDNKRLSLQHVSLRRQLESQKCSTARCREEKRLLQEKLIRCNQIFRHVADLNSCSNPGKLYSEKEANLLSRLANFFEKPKGVSKVRDDENDVKRCPTETTETSLMYQGTKLSKVATAVIEECVGKEGRIHADTFRTHLREAFDIPQIKMDIHRPSHKVGSCGVKEETISASRPNGDGGDI
ncbi:unnamed protein product [Hydatigera taeniaeformis]|uniref:Coiled-coil domain-containing protein 150 n=1 Tax=Hydatigena taeniaeformis TaxID=6205 RepID=A0A0R3WJC9_HYDTA|nr:unnamed protein product [Hydatigera taeniaeformis]